MFGGMPDWWMRRDATDPRAITTVVLASSLDRPPRLEVPKEIPHEVVHLDPADGVAGLARLAARAAESGRLLHVLWHDTRIVDDVWALEAMGLFELFPDTAMVGGRLHQNGRIVDAGAYFGFGRGCDAPDRGRPLEDPGYHVQAWKQHSVSAVSIDHCCARLRDWRRCACISGAADVSLDQPRRLARRGVADDRGGGVIYSAVPDGRDQHRPGDSRSATWSMRHSRRANVDLMPDRRYLPPHIALRTPAVPAGVDRRAPADRSAIRALR